jgi:hypothetical protein
VCGGVSQSEIGTTGMAKEDVIAPVSQMQTPRATKQKGNTKATPPVNALQISLFGIVVFVLFKLVCRAFLSLSLSKSDFVLQMGKLLVVRNGSCNT